MSAIIITSASINKWLTEIYQQQERPTSSEDLAQKIVKEFGIIDNDPNDKQSAAVTFATALDLHIGMSQNGMTKPAAAMTWSYKSSLNNLDISAPNNIQINELAKMILDIINEYVSMKGEWRLSTDNSAHKTQAKKN